MRISGSGRPVAVQSGVAAGRAAPAGAAAFAPAAAEAPSRAPAAASTGGAASVAGLDALMALQSIDPDGPRRRRRAVKRGHDLLDVLEDLKVGLLSGAVSGSALDRVASLVAALESSGDPRLDGLVADIALRAEVELAKLGRYVERR